MLENRNICVVVPRGDISRRGGDRWQVGKECRVRAGKSRRVLRADFKWKSGTYDPSRTRDLAAAKSRNMKARFVSAGRMSGTIRVLRGTELGPRHRSPRQKRLMLQTRRQTHSINFSDATLEPNLERESRNSKLVAWRESSRICRSARFWRWRFHWKKKMGESIRILPRVCGRHTRRRQSYSMTWEPRNRSIARR